MPARQRHLGRDWVIPCRQPFAAVRVLLHHAQAVTASQGMVRVVMHGLQAGSMCLPECACRLAQHPPCLPARCTSPAAWHGLFLSGTELHVNRDAHQVHQILQIHLSSACADAASTYRVHQHCQPCVLSLVQVMCS